MKITIQTIEEDYPGFETDISFIEEVYPIHDKDFRLHGFMLQTQHPLLRYICFIIGEDENKANKLISEIKDAISANDKDYVFKAY